jgi:hypothetical protein
MPEPKKSSCAIDEDPRAAEIADWQKLGLSATVMNKHLMVDNDRHLGYSTAMFSRHRTKCLVLPKLHRAPSAKVQVSQKAEDLTSETVSNEEMLRLSKIAFYGRLKNNPASITTKELVSVIGALSRKTDSAGGEEDSRDKLTRAMGDILND